MRIYNVRTIWNWDGPAEPEHYVDETPQWIKDLWAHSFLYDYVLVDKVPEPSDVVKEIRKHA